MTLYVCKTYKIEYQGTPLHSMDTEKFYDFLMKNCPSFWRDDNRAEAEREELQDLLNELPAMENLPLDREVLTNLINQAITESDQDDNYVHFEMF